MSLIDCCYVGKVLPKDISVYQSKIEKMEESMVWEASLENWKKSEDALLGIEYLKPTHYSFSEQIPLY